MKTTIHICVICLGILTLQAAPGTEEENAAIRRYDELAREQSPRIGFPYYGRDLRMIVQNQYQEMFLYERSQFVVTVSGLFAPDGSMIERRILCDTGSSLESALVNLLERIHVEFRYEPGKILRVRDHHNAVITVFSSNSIVRSYLHPDPVSEEAAETWARVMQRKLRAGDVVLLEMAMGT